jgi:hypothetical protein
MNPVPFLPSPRKAGQAIGLVGLGLGLGIGGTFPYSQALLVLLLALFGCAIGGHMLLKAIDKPDSNLVEKGCGLIGFGLGLGMGGTFPDGTEWVTWLLCAFWCIVGAVMLQRRSA